MPFILKTALKLIVGSQSLQIKVFLWLAEILVEQTSNEFDDQLVEILRDALGGDISTVDIHSATSAAKAVTQ